MNISYVPEVLLPSEVLILTTPINATHAYRFGLPRKNVPALCSTLNETSINPVFLLQLALASSLITACRIILKPFVRASIVSQIMGGIIGGPSGFGRNTNFLMITFPFKSLHMLNTFASIGIIFFAFIVGVKTDISLVKRTGKKEWKIGVSAFVIPLLAASLASGYLKQYVDIDQELKNMFINLSFLLAASTFYSIACFLDDLNLLNSGLGRVALSSSMISGTLSFVALTINSVRSKAKTANGGLGGLFSIIGLILVILFPLRYLLIWMIKQNPEGERAKESYVGLILLLVLGCAFAGEFIGLHAFVAPTLLGLVFPDRSVLAATVFNKVQAFVTFTILPLFFLSCGLSTELQTINSGEYFALQFLVLIGLSAKFLGITLVSVFCCDFVLKDAIILGLILSAVGITDIQFYRRSFQLRLIDYRCFSVLITSSMIMAGFCSYLVKELYDPFQRYIEHESRSIQHFSNDVEFRILVCVHNKEYVPGIINLLEASNPTRETPMCIYLLHLVELAGGISPAAVHQTLETRYHHDRQPRSRHQHHFSVYKPTESIINAFKIFERNNESLVTFQAFTAISPRATLHNDVCLLSIEKRARFIIIPFHIKWNSSGIATESPEFRSVNLKVIDKAPCSVGIFVDRGCQGGPRSVQGCWCLYRVGVFFIGGPDDREALLYATRMAKHPHVNVTLVRFIVFLEIDENTEEKRLDSVTISKFKKTNVTREKATYKEETLADSAETCNFIRSMENEFDLILVGRRTESPLLLGLSEWKEYPELGLMGDLLASKDFKGKASILVVQQHILESGIIPEIPSQAEEVLLNRESCTLLRYNQRSSSKVYEWGHTNCKPELGIHFPALNMRR